MYSSYASCTCGALQSQGPQIYLCCERLSDADCVASHGPWYFCCVQAKGASRTASATMFSLCLPKTFHLCSIFVRAHVDRVTDSSWMRANSTVLIVVQIRQIECDMLDEIGCLAVQGCHRAAPRPKLWSYEMAFLYEDTPHERRVGVE